MTRSGISIAFTASLALLATPAAAKPKPVDSWGRAGVEYETYRTDAVECALLAHYADVSGTKQAKIFKRATSRLEAVDNANYVPPGTGGAMAAYLMMGQAINYEQIRLGARPEKQIRELKHGMVGVVEDCLIERGYSQFRLTEDQREQLSKLDKGTDERRHFLHALAADAAVLRDQPVPVEVEG